MQQRDQQNRGILRQRQFGRERHLPPVGEILHGFEVDDAAALIFAFRVGEIDEAAPFRSRDVGDDEQSQHLVTFRQFGHHLPAGIAAAQQCLIVSCGIFLVAGDEETGHFIAASGAELVTVLNVVLLQKIDEFLFDPDRGRRGHVQIEIADVVTEQCRQHLAVVVEIPVDGGLSGRDVAVKMLRDNGIYDVQVTCTPGFLTDHYDPTKKTVNLSEDVYHSCSVSAAAVAAHECGHAVQHACAYAPLRLRSGLVPIVSFASSWMQWVLLIGMFTLNVFPGIMLFGIALFAMVTLFSFVTLPVEIDASRRAVNWLSRAGVTNMNNHGAAVSALRAAAYTYVVAALGSLASLVYYIMIYMGRRD